jgi:hypothetical protein
MTLRTLPRMYIKGRLGCTLGTLMYEATAGKAYLGLANLRMLLSRPTLRRSTPIATTAPRFMVRLNLDGVQDLRLVD